MTDALIELHFHCLPELDDGPLGWDEAVALCRAAARDGSTIIVATPHVLRYPWVNDDAAARDQRILRLNTLLGGQPKVLAGCEYLFSTDALELWDRGTAGPLTGLNRTGYLLTEFPWGIDVQNVSRMLYEFSLIGVTLVIAHPERQRDFIRDPGALELLVKRGAIAQLTAGSFLGDFGDLPREASFDFVERGLVHLVASDAHSLSSRPPRLAAARQLFEERWGGEKAEGIFGRNPEAVLQGKPVPFRLAGGASELETRDPGASRARMPRPADRKAGGLEARVEDARVEEARVEEEGHGRGRDPASLPEMAAAVAALLTADSPWLGSRALAEPPPFSQFLSRAREMKTTKPMALSPEQRKFYQRALTVTRQEISEVEVQIKDELAKAKDRVRELQNAQKAASLMYEAGCMRLGIPNNLKGTEPRH
jgi:protein-tyrosine phosphatase